MAKVEDVAAHIVDSLGPVLGMRLQGLVYYCQAWCLVWEKRPLFDNEVQAWARGPVVPDLYRHHRGGFLVRAVDGRVENLSHADRRVIDDVLALYGDRSAPALSLAVQKEGPWTHARQEAGLLANERGSVAISPRNILVHHGVNAVVYREGECYVAHAIERDICSQADGAGEAVHELARAIVTHVAHAESRAGQPFVGIGRAPSEVFITWSRGVECLMILPPVTVGGLTVQPFREIRYSVPEIEATRFDKGAELVLGGFAGALAGTCVAAVASPMVGAFATFFVVAFLVVPALMVWRRRKRVCAAGSFLSNSDTAP